MTCLSFMLVLDRSLVSFRTAKIASPASPVMLGCPARGRSHRPSMHPAGPLSFQTPAMRLSASRARSASPVSKDWNNSSSPQRSARTGIALLMVT
jgi:hypothetical protein